MPFGLRAEGLDFLDTAPTVLVFARVVPAERERVFASVVADPATWRSWFPGLRNGGYDASPPHGVGCGRWVRVRGMGTLRETVMARDEPTRWVYRVNSAGVPIARALLEEWTFTEHDAGTLVRYRFAIDPNPLFALLLRIAPGSIERTFDKAMRNLSRELAA